MRYGQLASVPAVPPPGTARLRPITYVLFTCGALFFWAWNHAAGVSGFLKILNPVGALKKSSAKEVGRTFRSVYPGTATMTALSAGMRGEGQCSVQAAAVLVSVSRSMRQPRKLEDGARYHVTARANRKEMISRYDAMKELFLSVGQPY
jgi:hypothetical protein